MFSALLRTLGYDFYTIGARVNTAQFDQAMDFTSIAHMGIVVTVESVPYLVDVGFGGDGLCVPITLKENEEVDSMEFERHRLVRLPLPKSALGSKVWHLQHCILLSGKDPIWRTCYAFDPLYEFYPSDFESMNWYASTNEESLFTNAILCTLTLRDGKEGKRRGLGSTIIHGNTFKERIHGQSRDLQTFKSESDRVQALSEGMKIRLTLNQVQAIKGRKTEIV